MRILLVLALLVLVSASVEAFRPRGSGQSPAGITVPAPAAAAGFTTLALNADFTQPMPANWLGGCAVAGSGSPNNTSDNTGHTWYLNYWWSNTYQNCNTAQGADPVFGGTVLDVPWATDSPNGLQGTVVESASWNYNPGISGETHDFPHNAYYEVEFRSTPIVAGVYTGIFTWPSEAIQSSTFGGLEYDIIEFDAGAMNLAGGAIHNWGVSGNPAGGWLGYGPPGLPLSHDPYIYHKYGMRTTSDGTNMEGCWYVDNVFITCIAAPGGLTPAEAMQREFVILQNACSTWNYSPCPNQGSGITQHLYIKTMRVWSCASWATTQCNSAGTPAVEKPGPSADLLARPTSYTCLINRYVATAAGGGSDSNTGTSPGTPWLTLGKANSTIPAGGAAAGYCINVAAGAYSSGQIALNRGGNAASLSGYVVYRCATLNGCVITATSSSPLFAMRANYIQIDGFDINCNSNTANVGIAIGPDSGFNAHHVWAINNIVRNCQLSGLQWNNTEYIFVLHNDIHDNSSVSGFLGSGVSIYEPIALSGYTPTAADLAWTPYKIVVNFNVLHDNFNPQSGSGNSDGNGLILDDWDCAQNPGTCSEYTGQGLVMGNIAYHNGARGLSAFSGGRGTFANNTSYNNFWDLHNTGTWRGNIACQDCKGFTFINNIAWAVTGSGVLVNNSPFLEQNAAIVPTYRNNVAFGASNDFGGSAATFPTTGPNLNSVGTSPLLVNAPTNNFALQAGSPARGFGQSFPLWKAGGANDAGACDGSLAVCP